MRKSLIHIAVGTALLGLLGSGIAGAAVTVSDSVKGESAKDSSASTATAEAQSAPAGGDTEGAFAAEQLEQLVAPIALYPDSLLMQILMASTYPLEIVEADRWLKKNTSLKGDALDAALKEQDWDPSVKGLCSLPDVVKQMSENLDWTQDLGDAVLAQKTELLDTVQKMRGLAYEEGNLKTTEQQTVSEEADKIIVIESADPEVIYVPSYSSTVVYGSSWGYPYWYYPPFYYPPPPGYGLVTFGIGLAIGGAIWGDCHWGWGHSDIDIDIDRHNNFNRNTSIDSDRNRIDARGSRDGKSSWKHDSAHRKGVNYRSNDVAQKFGASGGSSRVTRDQARGRSTASVGNRAASGGRAVSRDVAAPSRGTMPSVSRNPSASRPTASTRSSTPNYTRNNQSALSGSRSPSMDRRSSSRGAASRGTSSFGGRSGGLGGRGGGFGGRGGGFGGRR